MESLRNLKKYATSEKDLRITSFKRDPFSDKYKSGRLLIIGGSSSYYGAPILALDAAYQSLASLRIGLGYVKALVPRTILKTARTLSPNTIIEGLGKDAIEFDTKAEKEIDRADVILIGVGIGSRPKQIAAAKKIISYSLRKNKKIIVDAEAISLFKRIKINIKNRNVVITPHDHEFTRLTGIKLPTDRIRPRIEACIAAAKRHNLIIVLKGHYTVITDGVRLKINIAKTASLATMGTGDVLGGVIGGYAAKCGDLFKAVVAGVYLHSKIGDILFKEKGNHIIATDVIEKIPEVLKSFDRTQH